MPAPKSTDFYAFFETCPSISLSQPNTLARSPPSSPLPSFPRASPENRSRFFFFSAFAGRGLLRVLAFTLATPLLPSLLLAYTAASRIDAGRSRSTTNEGDAAVRLRTNTGSPDDRDAAVSVPVEEECSMRYSSRVKIWERPPSYP